MTASRARLDLALREGRTAVVSAQAEAPQRWAFGRYAPGGWAEVIHQLLGDGVFAGDRIRTHIRAGAGARAVVRGIAATPLRLGEPSVSATRIDSAPGASVIYLPGALVPHAGARHSESLVVNAAPGASVMAATILTPGRTAMGERGQFARLSMRTRATTGGELVLVEDTTIEAPDVLNPVVLGGFSVSLSLVCVGDWPPAEPGWWTEFEAPGAIVAASALRRQGVAVRGLFPGLGSTMAFLQQVEERARLALMACGGAGRAA